ncbi:hypothetical protein BKP37_15425 [Anaerobacillus alkalilacustris]|uniref:Diguanylate cyclase n=1 Tax=Anaerobacillus alkalilacustris TaxID=393763 RepID=A0A1S2LK22_9BACI|nr:diguanylate cyclase [Anaerobacillus alkalilacustris]OIJ11825.1 hypothetical protein BKP37_15425 [Anaerobacillus alkalilacustris]
MEKYQKALMRTIRSQIEQWFHQNRAIPHVEVYRFLHSIKGTSATIGLEEINQIVTPLMNGIEEEQAKDWEIVDLQQFLSELVYICYQDTHDELLFESNREVKSLVDAPEILLIDDDITLLMYLKEELEKQGWHVFATPDPEKAISFLYDYNPDCVIIDLYLKERTGFGVLSILNHKLTQQFVPQIMISVDNHKDVRMKSYQLGADDFIAKPFDLDEFVVRIKRQLERKSLVDSLVLVDELSGVYNRKHLPVYYERLCTEIQRKNNSFCLAVLDIDHFKKINDQYGHLVGDEVIKAFATYLNSSSRSFDTVFRFGGEEFVMLIPNCSLVEGETMLNRLLSGFSKQVFCCDEIDFSVTFSAGVVEINERNIPIKDALKAADDALFSAKESGRNTIKLWDKKLPKPAKRVINAAIVDDDPIIRFIMMDVLRRIAVNEEISIEIASFASGSEFFDKEWLVNEKPAFIILDGVLPDMDGNEILQQIRSLDHNERFTVLMLTARKSENDISMALKLGADDYVTKPFNISVIEDRIKRLIRKLK